MKARRIFDEAMTLYGVVNQRGTADQSRAELYENRALVAMSVMQREIYLMEQGDSERPIAESLRSMDDELVISDDSALRVMLYGLVMYFAEFDRDAFLYNTYSVEYSNRMQTVKRPRKRIEKVR